MSIAIEKEEKIKKNIIINQLLVNNIRDNKVIDAVLKFPRSLFLEAPLTDIACSDVAIQYAKNRFILDAPTLAGMMELANFKSSDVVLLIGAGVGYGSALISKMVNRVIAIEKDENILSLAEKNLAKLKISNVELYDASIKNSSLVHQCNRIFFEGAFAEIPKEINQLLNYKVDLIGILRENNLSKIINAKIIDNKLVLKYGPHTATSCFKNFESKDKFSF